MEQRYIYRRKRRRNNGPLILTLTIALVFGVGGFLIGRATARMGITSLTTITEQHKHYSCAKCGYEFDNLSELRLEISHAWHYYSCPMCGELLTSDVNGNAIDSINTSTYKGRTIDNYAVSVN